jgi:hypothetical protein
VDYIPVWEKGELQVIRWLIKEQFKRCGVNEDISSAQTHFFELHFAVAMIANQTCYDKSVGFQKN